MDESQDSEIIFDDGENNASISVPDRLRKEMTRTQVVRARTSLKNDDFFYPEDKLKPTDLNLIKKMRNVPNCTVLESGLRPTSEKVKFFYCSCDPNKIHQLCEECAMKCHNYRGHQVKEQPPAYIRCHCGEKAHNVEDRM